MKKKLKKALKNVAKIGGALMLGKALMGKRSGQKAVAVTPKGQTNLKIIDIN